MLQVFWLKIGRRIFRRIYQPKLNPYDKFSDHDRDIFAPAKRDFSYYSPFVDLSGNVILDIGSGLGRKTAFCSIKGGRAVGVDIDKGIVNLTKLILLWRKPGTCHFGGASLTLWFPMMLWNT
jgi:SAM-dependent methyltransferase